jgi:hypothetical protein
LEIKERDNIEEKQNECNSKNECGTIGLIKKEENERDAPFFSFWRAPETKLSPLDSIRKRADGDLQQGLAGMEPERHLKDPRIRGCYRGGS